MKFNIKHFFQYNRITKDNEENLKNKIKNRQFFFTYLDKGTALKQLNRTKKILFS